MVELSDGRLASGSYDDSIKIWNLFNGECDRTIPVMGSSSIKGVTSLLQLRDGRLVSGSYDETIKIWSPSY